MAGYEDAWTALLDLDMPMVSSRFEQLCRIYDRHPQSLDRAGADRKMLDSREAVITTTTHLTSAVGPELARQGVIVARAMLRAEGTLFQDT